MHDPLCHIQFIKFCQPDIFSEAKLVWRNTLFIDEVIFFDMQFHLLICLFFNSNLENPLNAI